MKKEEFNLNEKIIKVPMHESGLEQSEINKNAEKLKEIGCEVKEVILIEDVKEFIRLLKEMRGIEHDGSFVSADVFKRFVDKLAGEILE